MGVTGSGKTTVGMALAHRLAVPFCEGDALHPAANVARMHAGVPLEDEDRAPWLARVNAWLCNHNAGGVASCSALKRPYRDRLREGLQVPLRLILLEPPRQELQRRLEHRAGHFMPVGLLDSQLTTLEPPDADELALHLTGCSSPQKLVEEGLNWLAQAHEG